MKKMDKPKMKICYVAAADITLKFLLLNQLKYFKNKGYKVFAVCSPGIWVESIEKEGIEIKKITIKRKAFSPFSDLVSLFQLFFYFRKEKFNAVFTFTPKPGLLGQLAAKMASVPVIVNNIFGFYFHEKTPYLQRKFFILIEKIASLFSDAIFFRNKEDFKTAKIEKIGSPKKNKYLGDGIDMVRFYPEKFSHNFVNSKKRKIGINVNFFIIGIVARLVREKGYVELFEAISNVIKKFPNTMLLAIGSFDLEKKDSINPEIVKDYGIENNVLFLGERIDVDEMYALFDVFVLPSWREGFSHSIMEASAMAKPIIASNIRGCRGAIENGKTGILVPLKNSQKLAESIIYFIKNPKIAIKMGRLARKKAEQSFDERRLFEKTQQEYQNLIK